MNAFFSTFKEPNFYWSLNHWRQNGDHVRVVCCAQLDVHFLLCFKHAFQGTAKFSTNWTSAKIPVSLGEQYSFANKHNTLTLKRLQERWGHSGTWMKIVSGEDQEARVYFCPQPFPKHPGSVMKKSKPRPQTSPNQSVCGAPSPYPWYHLTLDSAPGQGSISFKVGSGKGDPLHPTLKSHLTAISVTHPFVTSRPRTSSAPAGGFQLILCSPLVSETLACQFCSPRTSLTPFLLDCSRF